MVSTLQRVSPLFGCARLERLIAMQVWSVTPTFSSQ